MNISDNSPQGQLSSQQFYRQYSANALLPELDWQSISAQQAERSTYQSS